MEFAKSGQRDQMLSLVHISKLFIEGSQLFFFPFKYYKTWTSKPDLRSRVEYYFYYYYQKKKKKDKTVTCTWCIVLFRLVVLEETMLLSFPKVWFIQVWISLIPIQQNIWRQCLVKTLTPVQLLTCLKDLFGWLLCPSQG